MELPVCPLEGHLRGGCGQSKDSIKGLVTNFHLVSCQLSGISQWRCTFGMRVTRPPGHSACLAALTAAHCRTSFASQSLSCPRIGSKNASWQVVLQTQVSCCLPVLVMSQNNFKFISMGLKRAVALPSIFSISHDSSLPHPKPFFTFLPLVLR